MILWVAIFYFYCTVTSSKYSVHSQNYFPMGSNAVAPATAQHQVIWHAHSLSLTVWTTWVRLKDRPPS